MTTGRKEVVDSFEGETTYNEVMCVIQSIIFINSKLPMLEVSKGHKRDFVIYHDEERCQSGDKLLKKLYTILDPDIRPKEICRTLENMASEPSLSKREQPYTFSEKR